MAGGGGGGGGEGARGGKPSFSLRTNPPSCNERGKQIYQPG